MSQCHDVYRFDGYRAAPARQASGTQCHDQEADTTDEASEAERSTADRQLQPA